MGLLLALALLALLGYVSSFGSSSLNAQSVLTELEGYAWSDNVGWISFQGSTYSVDIMSDKSLEGYGWSDNVGWVQFGNLSGCPAGDCDASINDNDELVGWARVLSYADGWDGWISLNCLNDSSCGSVDYGVEVGSNGTFPSNSAYAWGDDVVGWVDFDYAYFDTPCDPGPTSCTADFLGIISEDQWCEQETTACPANNICDPGPPPTCETRPPEGSINADPTRVRQDGMTEVTWSADYALSCTVEGTNGDSWTGTTNTQLSSALEFQTVFTLTCMNLDGTEEFELDSVTVQVLPDLYES